MAATLSPRVRHLKKGRFLASFELMGNISAACRSAEISRETYRHWMEHDEQFALAVRAAAEIATEGLEEEAHRRAVASAGNESPSDTLLIFLLKARAPHKYRDRVQVQHADADGQKLPVSAVTAFVREALGSREGA
jgi:hypothetical protein